MTNLNQTNPKILHRIYFPNFAPYRDPYEHYLESWRREMPDYQIMKWNSENLDVNENEWVATAWKNKSPVFLSEYFRWKVLAEFGGLYLDADCELLNGRILSGIVDELYSRDDYDTFFGVEEKSNGHPTAQTVGAKKGAELVQFMKSLYEDALSPLWDWRHTRGLIGPQLMALYFLRKGVNVREDGFFKGLDAPLVAARAKVYPQEYFSPKFSLLGATLNYDPEKTCVYHMFANANMDFADKRKFKEARDLALTFEEYRKALDEAAAFPRRYDLSALSLGLGTLRDEKIEATDADGLIFFGPYTALPKGRYVLSVDFAALPEQGSLHVSVSQGSGAMSLGAKSLGASEIVGETIETPFEVASEVGTDIEFLLHGRGIDRLAVRSLEVSLAAEKERGIVRPSRRHPKILHRIYFGFDGKADSFQRYKATWKEQLPDFEIFEWNASNLPMDINAYVRNLYRQKDHAFLTDYFRWWVLREYGGVYLDADVEIVNGLIFRQLVEELESSEKFDAFIGIDEKTGGWYTAHSFASKPGSKLTRFMCDVYENFHNFTVWRKKALYFWAPQLVALYFANEGHHVAGMGTSPHLDSPIVTARVKIYPQDWFSPLAPTGNASQPFLLSGMSENTCLCHHFACSWHDDGSPYLRHSLERGGQANILLRDIVAEAKEEHTKLILPAAQLSVGVGKISDAGIVASGAPGCLSFGPYIALREGKYVATYFLSSVSKIDDLSIDVIASGGDVFLGRGGIAADDVKEGRFQFAFTAPAPCTDVEFRVFVGRRTRLTLERISVDRLGAV